MTKDDLVWVLIRGVGFLLLLQALISLKDIASAMTMVYYGPPETTDFGQALVQSARNNVVTGAVSTVFYAVVGLYLLRKGNWLFRLLNYVRP